MIVNWCRWRLVSDLKCLFAPLAGIDLDHLEIYVVGGAVRDSLLGLTPKDVDFVAVGTTPETFLELGFQQVGQDFPVFLHPKSHAEIALARTERKTHKGHTGFVVHADPTVTLETDLLRRDFTINAMAVSRTGELIDPYGGKRIFNHTNYVTFLALSQKIHCAFFGVFAFSHNSVRLNFKSHQKPDQ